MANSWEGLIDAWHPVLRKAFLESIQALRNAAQIEQIARMLAAGDVDGALRAVGLDPTSFRALDRMLTATFEAGGVATAKLVPVAQLADGLRLIFQFNIRNPAAEAWLRDYSATLVKEILDDQRVMIRAQLEAAMRAGVNPRTAALDLVGRIGASGAREGGTLGLTSSQEQWVRNYIEELTGDNPASALVRVLRDKRFDAAVLRAQANGEPIPADLLAKMVAAYKNRALRFRAEGLARTEAMTALHQSQEMAMRQAVEGGVVSSQDVRFVWRTAHDSRVRDSHQTMDGQVARMGEDFITGAGARLRYPGDPFGPPEEVINCRCFREPKVDFLAGVR